MAVSGEQCVMMAGIYQMHMCCAENWAAGVS